MEVDQPLHGLWPIRLLDSVNRKSHATCQSVRPPPRGPQPRLGPTRPPLSRLCPLQASDRVTSALNVAQDLEDGALAWQLVHSRALGAAPGAAAAGVDEGAGGEEQAGAGEGRTSPRGQPRRRR